jgi:hypothetical protein
VTEVLDDRYAGLVLDEMLSGKRTFPVAASTRAE